MTGDEGGWGAWPIPSSIYILDEHINT